MITKNVNDNYKCELECAVDGGHRKSPHFRRNLMIFDLLTPSQGHQFEPRVKILLVSSLSCSTHHPLQFYTPHQGSNLARFSICIFSQAEFFGYIYTAK